MSVHGIESFAQLTVAYCYVLQRLKVNCAGSQYNFPEDVGLDVLHTVGNMGAEERSSLCIRRIRFHALCTTSYYFQVESGKLKAVCYIMRAIVGAEVILLLVLLRTRWPNVFKVIRSRVFDVCGFLLATPAGSGWLD